MKSNTLTPEANYEEEYPAIDFRALMKEEKRRARERLRAEKQAKLQKEQQSAVTSSDDAPTDPDNITASASPSLQMNVISSSQDKVPQQTDATTSSSDPLPRFDLARHKVSGSLDSVYYMSHFLQSSRQTALLEWLQTLYDSDDHRNANGAWTTMRYGKRRVALFGDDAPLPPLLDHLAQGLVDCGVFEERYAPNHVLVNEYQPGQGILPHTDGPSYHNRTATISIGGPVLLDFTPRLSSDEIGDKDASSVLQVLLEGRGSLVVFSDTAYDQYRHGIEAVDFEYASDQCVNAAPQTPVERSYRVSLTIRHKL